MRQPQRRPRSGQAADLRSPGFGLKSRRAFGRVMPVHHGPANAFLPLPPRNKGNARMAGRMLTREDLRQAAEKYKNWGKWGPDDEIGTLNYTSAEDIVAAARLVKKGKVISLALNFDHTGPQGAKSKYPSMGRINPVHTMLRTGTDAWSGVLDKRGIRAADDMVVIPLQCGTQWDGLGHVFYENYMWNGYECREVTSAGAQKCGIEKTKNKMVGRGVFLDVARYKGVEYLEDGYGITCEDLDNTAKKQKVDLKRGDYIVVRTGQMERCQKAGSWDGYPGGDAPGFAFETLEWVHRTELAALASDTWGCEQRPNQTDGTINQPWHWITIPIMGMTMGEIFDVKELAEDCAEDGVYEYLFAAPAIPITGGVGSPVNPLAIK
jgi:kynurenine formamidase